MLTNIIFKSNPMQLIHCKHSCDYFWPLLVKTTIISNCFEQKLFLCSTNRMSNESKSEDNSKDKTIFDFVKYTTTEAHLKHKAYQNFRFSDEEVLDTPVYERPILMISMAIFFLWFGYLRESNDIDAKMSRSLFEVVPGLEIPMIESALTNAERMGTDTRALRKRLAELKELKQTVDTIETKK